MSQHACQRVIQNSESQSRKTEAGATALQINILPLDRVGYGKIKDSSFERVTL